MKAKTISAIREMLAAQVSDARRDYKALQKKLEQKYDTEWVDDLLDDYEKKALYDLRKECYEAEEFFEDFESYQW
jgi:hypothetical protein